MVFSKWDCSFFFHPEIKKENFFLQQRKMEEINLVTEYFFMANYEIVLLRGLFVTIFLSEEQLYK